MKKNNSLLGIVAGIGIGLAIGVLFAPDKGRDTRKKLADKGKDAKGSIKKGLNEVLDSLSENLDHLKDAKDNFKDIVKNEAEKIKSQFSN